MEGFVFFFFKVGVGQRKIHFKISLMSSTPHQNPFFFLKNEWKKIYHTNTNWEEIFEKNKVGRLRLSEFNDC